MNQRSRVTGAVLAAALGLAMSTTAVSEPAYAAGTTWWVAGADPACTDTGTGTQTAPFCTITAAVKKAITPGDTVRVAPATYREQVTINGSGTDAAPITVAADGPGVVLVGTQDLSAATWSATATAAWGTPYAPPSTPRQVFLDGRRLTQAASASTTTSGSWFYDTTAKVLYVDNGGTNPSVGHTVEAGAQSYGVTMTSRNGVVVSGLEARGQNLAGFRALTSGTVTFDGVTSNDAGVNGILLDGGTAGALVRNATVGHALSTGVKLNATTGATVRGTTSHDNGLDGIGLATSTGNTITGNTTYGNASTNPVSTAVGINVNTSSTDNTVTFNTSYRNQDSGFQAYAGSARAVFARNVAWGNGDHGFDTLNATGVRYLNNTSYLNKRDGISIEGTSTGATVANNVLVDNGLATNEYDLYVDPGSVSGLSADHDLAYNHSASPAVKVNGTVYNTLTAWAAASGQEAAGLSRTPAFVDPANGDLRLQGGSPAVDSADSGVTGFVATDPAGNQPADDPLVPDTGAGSPAFADRGAYEFQPSGSPGDYAPHATVFANPASVAVPPSTPVTADASGSADADTQPIASYTFDFGDGSVPVTQTGATLAHRYSAPGSYTLSVTVTDSAGRTDVDRASVDVTARAVQTYSVEQGASGCSDTGPGTAATPYCSIAPALKVAVAGDTVQVGPGQYREQVTPAGTGEQGAPLVIHATSPDAVILGSADLSDPTAWTATSTTAWSRAYSPTAVPTQAWLDDSPLAQAGSATTTTSGSWFYDAAAGRLYVDVGGANPAVGHTVAAGARNFGVLLRGKSYVEVSGFTVRQTNLTGVYADASDHLTLAGLTVSQAGSHGVTVDGSTAITLDHITSSSNLSIGVRFNNSADSTLTDASTHHNQLHGVSLQGSRNVVVTRVTSYANAKPGQRVAAGIDVSQGSTDCTVQDSTSYGNDDSGFEAYTGASGTVFRRNLSYDNGDHGIDNSAAPGSVVVSNTVVGNATAGINFEGSSGGATSRDNVTADNAVGSTRTIGEIRVDESSSGGTSLDRDLVFQSNGGPLFEWSSQPYTTLPDFRAASGQEPDGLAANPRFVDLAARDLRLSPGSPAVDAAYTGFAAWARLDHDGTPPVDDPSVADSGNGPDAFADLGALEYGGPAAVGSLAPSTGYAPLAVAVDGSASQGLTAPLTDLRWACGNGTSVVGAQGTCTYSVAGTYTAVLTVTDGDGRTDTWSGTVNVLTEVRPTAALTATPTSGYVPQDVTLDASASTDPDATPIATYTFNCGNGQRTTAQSSPQTTCSYPTAGNFTATVTVTDTAGLSASKSVTVKALADVAPTPVLDVSPMKISKGGSVVADGSRSTDADKTPIASYRFDCGNGTGTGVQASPTTTCNYSTTAPDKSYTLRMWVTDTGGRTASTTQKIQVR